jgi:hypothetical protein
MPTARYVTKARHGHPWVGAVDVEWHQTLEDAQAYADRIAGNHWIEVVEIYALAWLDSVVGGGKIGIT